MIERRALIIECSEIAGLGKIAGAQKDAYAWQEYLLSKRGGAWRDNEITILNNPTPQAVRSKIALMSTGYSFVAFSGHGHVNAYSRKTMVCLQGGDISESELTPSSSRATVILDSCRGETFAFAEAMEKRAMLKAEADSSQYRNLFDAALERSEYGVCQLYGCAFKQAAHENPEIGGDFTQALIQAGKKWAGSGVFSLLNASEAAEKVVRQKRPQQTPECNLGRRINHFPFAVQP